ncbi:VOC family protein [Nocardioides panacisoli]|uniref:Glyoxalase-like domain-containing protein n=1 Tax=Nocardioides panacisoli TaxID=627624 RepID=A0ABP7HY81_9ACTN
MTVNWLTAFLDLAPASYDAGVGFWAALTDDDVSPSRGVEGEFATLLPSDGDAYLRVQRLGRGPDGLHLDLHVDDPRDAAERAVGLGAREVADLGYYVMASPGGFTFCLVPGAGGERARPSVWPGGQVSALDQVCVDVPAARFDAECAFWAALTGWELRGAGEHTEFRSLARPPEQPLRILLQELGADDPGDAVRGHLDWACTDRPAETDRHAALGATVEEVREGWTVLVDPTGRRYCITDRDPGTGLLSAEPRRFGA